MLTNEQIVQAWKNPAERAKLVGVPAHPAGQVEFSMDLNTGDVQAETTPATPWIIASSVACGDVAATIIITVTSC